MTSSQARVGRRACQVLLVGGWSQEELHPPPKGIHAYMYNPQITDPDLDTMPYPYSRYTDGPDAESHIRAFVSTWQANHSTHRLTATEIESSKITKFTLSLDGPSPRWYSRLEMGEFTMFQDVRTKFLELFDHEVPKRELLRQFFTMSQEPQETIA